jgi:hypothetical protein
VIAPNVEEGKCGPRPNFLDHQEGVVDGRHSGSWQGHSRGEPLRSSRRIGAGHPMLLVKAPAAVWRTRSGLKPKAEATKS